MAIGCVIRWRVIAESMLFAIAQIALKELDGAYLLFHNVLIFQTISEYLPYQTPFFKSK